MVNLADVNTKVALEDIKEKLKVVPDDSDNPLFKYVEYESKALKATKELCPYVTIERVPRQALNTPAVQMFNENFWLTLNLYIVHYVPGPDKLTIEVQNELDAIMQRTLLYLEKPETGSDIGLNPTRTSTTPSREIWSWWPQRRKAQDFEDVKSYPVNGVLLPVGESEPMFCRKVTLSDINVRFRN